MKKLIALLLVMALCLCLAACGGGDKPLNYTADDFRSRNGFLRQGAYAWQGKPENRG